MSEQCGVATMTNASGTVHTWSPGDHIITVSASGLSEAQRDALFDRVANAAHALDEDVSVMTATEGNERWQATMPRRGAAA